MTRIAYDELEALLRDIFLRHGCSKHVADLLAANMAGAERDGAHSHGVFRIKGNLGSLDSGWLDGKAVPVLEDVAPGMLRADGRNGFSLPVLAMAAEPLMDKARSQWHRHPQRPQGTSFLGRVARHRALRPGRVPRARHRQLDGIVVPHGGHRKLYGTNPMGFAVPREAPTRWSSIRPPAPWPMATCRSRAARAGSCRRAPESIATGNPTTDPNAVLEGGALLPFGGPQGLVACHDDGDHGRGVSG